jgi:hypothetical protein
MTSTKRATAEPDHHNARQGDHRASHGSPDTGDDCRDGLIDDLAWMPNGSLSVARWRYRDRPTITQAQFQAVALAEPIGQKEVRHAVGGAAR